LSQPGGESRSTGNEPRTWLQRALFPLQWLVETLLCSIGDILAWLWRRLGAGEQDGRNGKGQPDPLLTPRQPGEVAPTISSGSSETELHLQRAFASAIAGTAGSSDPTPDVIWVDGGNELLVRPSKTRTVFRPGFALVGITVHSEQTGDVEVVIPFALGAPNAPLGMIAATEKRPRGPQIIVDTWGEQLIAAAWDALLRVIGNLAAAGGVDVDHQPLIPMAVVADTNGLSVTPQARHAFDRIPR